MPPGRVRTGGYPFAVLAGADASAVLVELTNVEAGAREEMLDSAARDIARAILVFVKK